MAYNLSEIIERTMTNLTEAISTHDQGIITEQRVHSGRDDFYGGDNEIWDEALNEIGFYLPYKRNGKRLIGKLVLTIEEED